MIDYLKGTVVDIDLDYIVLERNGMGYQLFVIHPTSFVEGQSLTVYTHMVVREDGWRLFGFSKKVERVVFRLLLDVSGIGPKAAMNIMVGGSAGQIIQAIEQENMRFLTSLPGIGKKTAQRIILDIKEKLPKLGLTGMDSLVVEDSPPPAGSMIEKDVLDALLALGYSESESRSVIQSISTDQSVEAAIREALNHLMRR